MKRFNLLVEGIVQGVGFRPFVYKTAIKYHIQGKVMNSQQGLYIDIQGEEKNIEKFIQELKEKAPVLSYIENIQMKEKEPHLINGFYIVDSERSNDGFTFIPPDIGTCKECMKEVEDIKNSRRYEYVFTNCTNCGPRYSVITKLPYDRKYTTMSSFKMCNYCEKEYISPNNRRFHAEPTCCKKCGPSLRLLNNLGEDIQCKNVFLEVIELIKRDKILAIKGIGGYNIVCNGHSYETIAELRKRKRRSRKPLAVMMKNMDVVKKYCSISEKEELALKSQQRPIVLLNKLKDSLPYNISFNNTKLGIILPYTPLHHFLFDENIDALIFTSGNISNSPIIYEDERALQELRHVVDFYLIHNRDINMPIDDSVISVMEEEERIIRPGRGYYPLYERYGESEKILALGGILKNSIGLSCHEYAVLSPYTGNVDTLEGYNNCVKNINHFKGIYNIEPDIICYDMHPNNSFNSYLESYNCKKIGTYHHHSHIASCMAENNFKGKVIGIAYDGVGYGEDEKLWGGEFLICDYKSFQRVGHINYLPLVGGDKATKSPWIIGVGLVFKALELNCKNIMDNVPEVFKEKEVSLVAKIIEKDINVFQSSSIGRLFDGVASLLGFIEDVSFEGEAAIYMENLAKGCTNKEYRDKNYSYDIEWKENYVINTDSIIKEIMGDLENHTKYEAIALKFHNSIINFSADMCIRLREKYNINTVALSGGVFQNEILFTGIYKILKKYDFEILTHKKVPCNDSGLALGQLFIAREILRGEKNVCCNTWKGH